MFQEIWNFAKSSRNLEFYQIFTCISSVFGMNDVNMITQNALKGLFSNLEHISSDGAQIH